MGYESLIETAGVGVVDSVHSGDYQGDLYMIVERDGKYGYVVTGYGSCSGCDAYEAARDDDVYSENWEDRYDLTLAQIIERKPEGELVQLRDSILRNVKWVDNQADLAVLLAEDLSENAKGLRWYYSEDSFRKWALEMIDKYTVEQED
jgi:hypothetical protein